MNNPKRSPIFVLIAISLLCLIFNIDYTSINIAIVSISNELHTKLINAQWIISGYIIAIAATSITFGKISDAIGKEKAFIIGMYGFAFSSLIAGLSNNFYTLLISRVIQGLSASFYIPPSYSLVYAAFPENKHGWAIGVLSATVGVGLALGPPLAGIALHYFSWRWIFFINIPLALISGGILHKLTYIKTPINKEPIGHDLYKGILLSLSILTLMLSLYNLNNQRALGTSLVWIILSTFFTSIFLFTEKFSDRKWFGISLFKSKNFIPCILLTFLFQIISSCIILFLSIYLQKVNQLSPFRTGMIFLYLTIVWGLISPFGGMLVDRFNIKKPIITGFSILSLGCFLIFISFSSNHFMLFAISQLVCGMGFGLTFPSLNTLIIKSVSPEHIGIASGSFISTSMMGSSIIVVIGTVYFVHTYARFLSLEISKHHYHLNSNIKNYLINNITNSRLYLSKMIPEKYYHIVNSSIQSAITRATIEMVIICLFLALSCIILSLLYLSSIKSIPTE